jgi:hypothetical protein
MGGIFSNDTYNNGVTRDNFQQSRPKFCSNCGEKLDLNTEIKKCSKCGNDVHMIQSNTKVVEQLPYKSPGTAALIAFIGGIFGLVGIGHIYVGKVHVGIILLISSLVIYALLALNIFFSGFSMGLTESNNVNPAPFMMIIIGAIGYLGLWIWQIFDARNLAKKFNESVRSTGKEPW